METLEEYYQAQSREKLAFREKVEKTSGARPPSFAPETQSPSQPGPNPAPPPENKLQYSARVHPYDPIFPGIRNLVDVWNLLHPEIRLYGWQAEELLRISGHRDGRLTTTREDWSIDDPMQAAYVCANGSGKDMALIATTAVGLPLLYRDVLVVITSSSHDQLKHQTQNHISRAITKLNNELTPIYTSVEFYHECKAARGGEIKLFATNEAGRAEGWHPMEVGGRLVIIVNEAKSISPPIFDALDRCWGWSHWLEVSSPGPRRGLFYNNYKRAHKYFPGFRPPSHEFIARKVDSKQVPHITPAHEKKLVDKHGENSFIVQTSLRANFYEQESETIIGIQHVEACEGLTFPDANDVGIGLDGSAGGDETSLYVRRGPSLSTSLCFDRERDTIRAVQRIHRHLINNGITPDSSYVFNLDDGGLSRTFTDQLTLLGWRLSRRLNQSAAYNKQKYLNLGAEIWHHTGLLFERHQIPAPKDHKLIEQLTTRPYDETGNQGKISLRSKTDMKAEGLASPDRADGFCLCYFSYRPGAPKPDEPESPTGMSTEELLARMDADPFFLHNLRNPSPKHIGNYTIQ